MILHDEVTVQFTVMSDPPVYDEYGFPQTETVDETVRAEVFPLGTEVVVQDAIVSSRYRIVLAPTVDIPPGLGDNLRLGWGPFAIDPADSATGLRVDGTVERHMVRGRLHHYELITKTVE
ncbi:hypothetical protein [Mycolicibacterium gilvum]|uniref:Uncharacterized protein n=1 Tax=Mycolicibacterium gilvum TaxID=1804 RepID=A0A378SGH9_9MYCO|nr:hypothetical protein [Mycolicibacterium gilvum]MCV7056296.1 hypothetical protein [Mycolicibacterium gilvum]STZ41721.1 Uncharacterised protein [Mycolicibacterium gilvum]